MSGGCDSGNKRLCDAAAGQRLLTATRSRERQGVAWPLEPPQATAQLTPSFQPCQTHFGLLASENVNLSQLVCSKPVSLWQSVIAATEN